MTDLLDLIAASKRADLGMTRAIDHADREVPDWSERALECLLLFAGLSGEPFLIEAARDWAGKVYDLPAPPDSRAWGAVVTRAKKAGHIVKVGYGSAASSNCSPKVLWERAKAG